MVKYQIGMVHNCVCFRLGIWNNKAVTISTSFFFLMYNSKEVIGEHKHKNIQQIGLAPQMLFYHTQNKVRSGTFPHFHSKSGHIYGIYTNVARRHLYLQTPIPDPQLTFEGRLFMVCM